MIYEKEGKPLADQAKVQELLWMCANLPIISATVTTLKVQANIGALTYTQAVNHIQSVVT